MHSFINFALSLQRSNQIRFYVLYHIQLVREKRPFRIENSILSFYLIYIIYMEEIINIKRAFTESFPGEPY